MKKIYFLLLGLFCLTAFSQNVTITKIIETGCSSEDGFVKTVELYVDGTVDFATEVTLNYMQNGDPWADNQIDISALGVQTDSFVYIVRDIPAMQAELPSTTFDASNTVVVGTSTNGDDGYQVVLNGNIVSQFGKTETDADNDPDSNWQHNDAISIRLDNTPDLGTWDPTHWSISAENILNDHTACQGSVASANLEAYFASLGGIFPLGSGSGWTPSANDCTTTLGETTASCESTTAGAMNDTYSATVEFANGNNGFNFTVSSTAGTVGGDDPTTTENGIITIANIPEGTGISVTVSDLADGGNCDLSVDVTSPFCLPLVINEVLFDPPTDDDTTPDIVEGDANNDGTRDSAQDEFIEFYNDSDTPLDISGFKVFDANAFSDGTPRHVFPANTVIPANRFLVLFGGGTPTGTFGNSVVQVASEGMDPQLNLTNGGDIITILTPNDEVVLTYSSVDTGINHGENQSVTRDPDFTGQFDLHTNANANLVYSPGLLIDGTTLSIEDLALENDIVLYPIPLIDGKLNIETNLTINNIEVYNMLGAKVFSKNSIENYSVDLSNLESGAYIIKLTSNQQSISKKIIIK